MSPKLKWSLHGGGGKVGLDFFMIPQQGAEQQP